MLIQKEKFIEDVKKRSPDAPLTLQELFNLRELMYHDIKKEPACL
jgi:hypothetical protein